MRTAICARYTYPRVHKVHKIGTIAQSNNSKSKRVRIWDMQTPLLLKKYHYLKHRRLRQHFCGLQQNLKDPSAPPPLCSLYPPNSQNRKHRSSLQGSNSQSKRVWISGESNTTALKAINTSKVIIACACIYVICNGISKSFRATQFVISPETIKF